MTDLLRGRALDAAIATEVFGWLSVAERKADNTLWGYAPLSSCPCLVPRYHDDDNACMGVVRELQSRGYKIVISLPPEVAGEEATTICHVASPGWRDPLAPETWVSDKDDRIAILNAALRAVRKEQGDG